MNRTILKSLLRADFTVQWRNRRSPVMASVLALVMLVTLKQTAQASAGADWKTMLLGVAISIVLMGMGLLGYTTLVSRDRDRGVFNRLRTTPASSWAIMTSRLVVQFAVMAVLTCVVLIVAALAEHIILSPLQYILTILTGVLGGALYLGIGQTLVGLIASSDTLNAAARVIYFALALAGSFVELGALGHTAAMIAKWSPYGTVQSVLQAAMQTTWSIHVTLALILTLAYTAFFVAIGIKHFRWTPRS